jgi:hypothetical protein
VLALIAVCAIRDQPVYRRHAFIIGLRKAGYTVTSQADPKSRDDLYITWNRYGPNERTAELWERDGGSVLVAENGYIGTDSQGRQLYAISIGQHNGAGRFPVSTEDRFARLGIAVKPWRTDGEHVLICAQRGIGSRLMASPDNWHASTERYLRARTKRPIRTRLHPGNKPAVVPLASDLAGAWACAVWSSASGVKALTLGIPVLYDAPHWIASEGARPLAAVETPLLDDACRLAALHRMAHGQWTVEEIESGEPFVRLREFIRAEQ